MTKDDIELNLRIEEERRRFARLHVEPTATQDDRERQRIVLDRLYD